MHFFVAALLIFLAFISCTSVHTPQSHQAYHSKQQQTQLTPVLARIDNIPQAFLGSDNKYHLAYELILTNYHNKIAHIDKINITNYNNKIIYKLDHDLLASRMISFGSKQKTTMLKPGQSSVIYLHLEFKSQEAIPPIITHELLIKFDNKIITEQVASFSPNLDSPLIIGPPLQAQRILAADSCCSSTRHMQAGIPLNGSVQYAQRFALDFEQMDQNNRLFHGSAQKLSNYYIYGQEVLAVLDGIVIAVQDGLLEELAGALPQGITLKNVHGNSVILQIAPHRYALYAHLQPGSIVVHEQEQLKRGHVIGRVGNSGNSQAPHLHFQVMDSPHALKANGVPYLIDSSMLIGIVAHTADFDHAEQSGTPMSVKYLEQRITNAFPMDLNIFNFDK